MCVVGSLKLVIRVIVVSSLEVLDDDTLLLCVVAHGRLVLCKLSNIPVAIRLLHSTDQKFTSLLEEMEVGVARPITLRQFRTMNVEGVEELRDLLLKLAVHASIVAQLRSDVKMFPIRLAALSRR
mgnify:CR=1 FL=1